MTQKVVTAPVTKNNLSQQNFDSYIKAEKLATKNGSLVVWHILSPL